MNDWMMDFGKPRTVDSSSLAAIMGRTEPGFAAQYEEPRTIRFKRPLRDSTQLEAAKSGDDVQYKQQNSYPQQTGLQFDEYIEYYCQYLRDKSKYTSFMDFLLNNRKEEQPIKQNEFITQNNAELISKNPKCMIFGNVQIKSDISMMASMSRFGCDDGDEEKFHLIQQQLRQRTNQDFYEVEYMKMLSASEQQLNDLMHSAPSLFQQIMKIDAQRGNKIRQVFTEYDRAVKRNEKQQQLQESKVRKVVTQNVKVQPKQDVVSQTENMIDDMLSDLLTDFVPTIMREENMFSRLEQQQVDQFEVQCQIKDTLIAEQDAAIRDQNTALKNLQLESAQLNLSNQKLAQDTDDLRQVIRNEEMCQAKQIDQLQQEINHVKQSMSLIILETSEKQQMLDHLTKQLQTINTYIKNELEKQEVKVGEQARITKEEVTKQDEMFKQSKAKLEQIEKLKTQMNEQQEDLNKKQTKMEAKMQAMDVELQQKVDKKMEEINKQMDEFQTEYIPLQKILSNLKTQQKDMDILSNRNKKIEESIEQLRVENEKLEEAQKQKNQGM